MGSAVSRKKSQHQEHQFPPTPESIHQETSFTFIRDSEKDDDDSTHTSVTAPPQEEKDSDQDQPKKEKESEQREHEFPPITNNIHQEHSIQILKNTADEDSDNDNALVDIDQAKEDKDQNNVDSPTESGKRQIEDSQHQQRPGQMRLRKRERISYEELAETVDETCENLSQYQEDICDESNVSTTSNGKFTETVDHTKKGDRDDTLNDNLGNTWRQKKNKGRTHTPNPKRIKTVNQKQVNDSSNDISIKNLLPEWDDSSNEKFDNVRWLIYFEKLLEFKRLYGHCNVPKKDGPNGQLGRWVSEQRQLYKLMIEGGKCSMTSERIICLDEIGFQWNYYSKLWEERYDQLKEFKKQHGHCNVPLNYGPNKKLGTWVGTQRRRYRFRVKGNESRITRERFRLLEKIGFQFEILHDQLEQTYDELNDQWEQTYKELVEFQKKHGHCHVPERCKHLHDWTYNQRKKFKDMMDGNSCAMTLERLDKLEKIGFDFEIHINPWKEKYYELIEFEKEHGHCNVPYTNYLHRNLADWVRKQRIQYLEVLDGKPSQLTLEQQKYLEEIGFEWDKIELPYKEN